MFNSVSGKKVYELVIEQIQDNILNGKIKKGDQLPSERELSEQMGVSRTSIREAIRVLETMGLIESRQGEGNFICAKVEKSFIQPLSIMFKLNDGNWDNILELRELLELQTASIAAQKITKEEEKELDEIMIEMEKETNGENREKILVIIDQKFHKKIASISKNYLIESFFITASKLFEQFIEDARVKIIEAHAGENILYKEHNEIYKAIKQRNPELAYEKMKQHMELIKKSYEKLK
ncbi:FadR/GntR family transcriptional regulator [Romboutsia sp.]|uniref:FadR/GntR family transcriptional regulator n=1 Tax=Romboutsia sp. TaxID=1965302 RepID=UPI003F2F6D1A